MHKKHQQKKKKKKEEEKTRSEPKFLKQSDPTIFFGQIQKYIRGWNIKMRFCHTAWISTDKNTTGQTFAHKLYNINVGRFNFFKVKKVLKKNKVLMSKKSWPNIHNNLLYKLGQDF